MVTAADAGATRGVASRAYLVPFPGMLSLVAATFLERRAPADTPPSVALTVHCATSAVVFTALASATGAAAPPAGASFWTAVVWLVALSTLGGYGLYWLVLRRSGVTRVNALMFLVAPVTAVWGALLHGEPFGAQTGIGVAAALAAVAIVHRCGDGGGGAGPRPHRIGAGRTVAHDAPSTAPRVRGAGPERRYR